jgi:hypothetical protein
VLGVTTVPLFARLRGHPRFEALIARLAARRGVVRRPVQAGHPGPIAEGDRVARRSSS